MIIDTHIHLYDPFRPQGVPFPEPDDEIYRQVLPEDYKVLAEPEGVTGVVVVEASEWIEDNQWILDLAAGEPLIVGFVGNLDPYAEDFDRHLDRFAANPIFRGIRPRLRQGEESRFLAAMENLAARDLELDTGMSENLCDLARRLPELRVVINHIGGIPIDGNPPDPARMDLMRKVAEYPQIYMKVSGLMDLRSQVQPAPTDLAFYTPVLDALWETFGEDRLIYGSDWPVSDRSGRSYAEVQRLVQTYFAAKGAEASEKYFWKNSKAAYKWIDRPAARS